MNYADIERMAFIPQLYAEMLPVLRATNAKANVTLEAKHDEARVRLEVFHYRTWNRRWWEVDEDCWQDAVRQAKQLLTEWHETEVSEPRPFVHQW